MVNRDLNRGEFSCLHCLVCVALITHGGHFGLSPPTSHGPDCAVECCSFPVPHRKSRGKWGLRIQAPFVGWHHVALWVLLTFPNLSPCRTTFCDRRVRVSVTGRERKTTAASPCSAASRNKCGKNNLRPISQPDEGHRLLLEGECPNPSSLWMPAAAEVFPLTLDLRAGQPVAQE